MHLLQLKVVLFELTGIIQTHYKNAKEYCLSYNVAVFQWITSCNTSVMTTHVLTLLREYVTSLTTSVTTMLIFIGNMSILKAIKLYLRCHMIKQILHLWSFHMKFIKLAKVLFNKFHMKRPLV